jgi:type 2 lantibiotic biosynthesis protein LanM
MQAPEALSAWPLALSLAERIAASSAPGAAAASGESRERAVRRLKRWRATQGERGAATFATLTDALPGGEAQLTALLGEAPEDLARRAGPIPPWAEWLRAAIAQDSLRPAGGPEREIVTKSYWVRGFSRVVAPFTRRAVGELERRLRDSPEPDAVRAEPLVKAFAGALAGQLVVLVSRVLVLELNVRRLEGGLTGADGAERFWSFAEQASSPAGLDALFQEYPVLGRLVAQRAENSLEAAWELCERWRADRELIAERLLGGGGPRVLSGFRFGAGDAHRGGRSVALLELAGGERLVYKPRPLAAQLRFNAVLEWLGGAAGLDMRGAPTVDRGEYGWAGFVAYGQCADSAAVSRYYERLGILMALLHALDGADFHYENLIACGEYPVAVDVETLFHPPPASRISGPMAEDPALGALGASVFRLGILPIPVTGAEGSVDFGGLGGQPAEAAPHPVAGWADDGTDTMRVVRQPVPFAGGENRPAVAGIAADPLHHVDDLVAGFHAGYRAIAARCAGPDGPGGLLAGFGEVETRVALRPTQVYATLLSEGVHPDLLRDALDRDRHFSLLWTECAQRPELARVIPHELADLWAGDVPLFTTSPGLRELRDSQGARLADFFAESGIARARRKLAGFGEDDLARQEWVIRAALAGRAAATGREPAASSVQEYKDSGRPSDAAGAGVAATGQGPLRPALAQACQQEARRLADLVARRAVRDGQGRAGWLGLTLAGGSAWQAAPLRWDLYGGFSGVALFLDAVGRLLGEPDGARYRELAREALWPVDGILAVFEAEEPERLATMPDLGGMAGLPGLAYALACLAEGLEAEELRTFAARAVRLTAAVLDADESYDVLGGGAGSAAALLAVHSAGIDAAALELAARAGRHLLGRAIPTGEGLAWPVPPGAEALRPLTGFAHGAGGIGWALIRLGSALGERDFTEAGLAAFSYERGEYDPRTGNWPDHRVPGKRAPGVAHGGLPTGSDALAWCHGAAGIGLARVGALSLVADPGAEADLDAAAAVVRTRGFGGNHSLCHGDLGNAELMLLAAQAEARSAAGAGTAARGRTSADGGDGAADQARPRCPAWAAGAGARLERVVEDVLAGIAAGGPRCGTPNEIETPSLMTGLSGIGYGLLRLAAPDRLPPVQLLWPPSATSSETHAAPKERATTP